MQAPSPNQDMQMRMGALSAGLRRRGICVLHQGVDHRFDLIENAPPNWPLPMIAGGLEVDILPAVISADFAAAHDRCRSTGKAQTLRFDLGAGVGRRHFEASLQSDADGVTTILVDTTEERARDMAVASLLREVSHRSKNLLAIVQSVAMQTAHHSHDTQDFLDKFRGRLHALSSSQDLVTESNWRGTHLQSLIVSQLTRIGQPLLNNVRITGENPLLGPNASLHIGLAIHELGVNAVRHGALSNGSPGQVRVDAQVVGQPAELIIEWHETAMDATSLQHEPHFGTLVLERIVPLSVGGSADFSIAANSVRYRLIVPADQFEN